MDFAVRKVAAHVELSNENSDELTIIPEMYVEMSPFGRVCLFQGVNVMFADVMRNPPNHFPVNLDKNNL